MDFALFQWINNLSETLPWASPLMVFSAKYLPILFALTLVILWFTFDRKQQLGAFLAGVSALLALGSAQVIASLYPRPRPYITHAVHLLIEHSQDPSFPSDHAVFSFAIAAMIWRYNRKVGNVLVGLAILIGFASDTTAR
ncbi:MAG TPA: phosphatase PAP2 family protein [Sulfuricurvum sp.]|nr:phosphatase PAP2 family protein [Sulfuricurvum sp.]